MAEKTGAQKLSGYIGGSVVPQKPFPPMPEALKTFGNKEFQEAMRAWDKELQEWHKTPVVTS